MNGTKRQLLEVLIDSDVRKLLEDWATGRAMQAQDQAVTELMRHEPAIEAAIQKAAASKVYEGLLAELLDFLREKPV